MPRDPPNAVDSLPADITVFAPRGVLIHFVNPRNGLTKVTKSHDLPTKRLKIKLY